jgi:phosphopantothenoylcysteine decarboxylase/phosphopantothenate--cysteine ligase
MSCCGKNILLGVTGSIAAYKACHLVRLLVKAKASIQVIMTQSATQFVGVQSFETLSSHPVHVEMFPKVRADVPWHVELARWADLFLVAPATANIIGKIANGIADDLLSATAMTCDKLRMIAPTMNPRMFENPVLQRNLKELRRTGWHVLEPEFGEMAHPLEDQGKGRMPEPEQILQQVESLWGNTDYRDVRILVTAGRTEEPWDAVRILTNPASGRMGFAVAEEACSRGADVTLIAGPHDIPEPKGCRIIPVRTARQMAEAVNSQINAADVLIMCAAVSDFRPKNPVTEKLKKTESATTLELEPTVDILSSLPPASDNQIRVGFAVETGNVVEQAQRKLTQKHLDIIVANDPTVPGAGFRSHTNHAIIIDRQGHIEKRPLEPKQKLAARLLDLIAEKRKSLEKNNKPQP